MHGFGGGVLSYLLGAAEAVGDEDRVCSFVADGGEEDALAQFLREVVFVFFEAEGTGHAAAAGVEKFHFGSGEAEEG